MQDMFGVSMIVPILSKHARQIGASPAVAGLIGKNIAFHHHICHFVGNMISCIGIFRPHIYYNY